MRLNLAGELQRCLYSRTVAGFGVWWSLQCVVGATVPADGSAGCLLLWMETPVTVASAALGGVAGDVVIELCVEGITPKELVWLAGEGILWRTVM